MSLEGCLKANQIAESLLKHQQKLFREMSNQDNFTADEQVEILVASVRMLTATVYKTLSCKNPKTLEFLISGTEKCLREAIKSTVKTPSKSIN